MPLKKTTTGAYEIDLPIASVGRGEYVFEIAASHGADQAKALVVPGELTSLTETGRRLVTKVTKISKITKTEAYLCRAVKTRPTCEDPAYG